MSTARVVVADSSVTAPQMMDFWRKVGDGTIDGPIFQGFLSDPRRFVSPDEAGKVTLARAINVLGDRKVVGVGQAATAWGLKEFDSNIPIRYSEQALRQAADANRQGFTDYRLVYIHGFSLREQRAKVGVDKKHQPCYYNNDWWIQATEDGWANGKPAPGYYLLDFKGRYANMNWQAQEDEVGRLGPDFERAPEAAVAEAVISIFKVYDERLLPNWYHWGRSLDSLGRRVCVGYFDAGGVGVGSNHPSYGYDYLRVVVARKFQS